MGGGDIKTYPLLRKTLESSQLDFVHLEHLARCTPWRVELPKLIFPFRVEKVAELMTFIILCDPSS